MDETFRIGAIKMVKASLIIIVVIEKEESKEENS